MEKILEESPYGVNGKVYLGNDLWHMRSLVFTDKPDFMIGNSYGKFIQRDTLYKGAEFEVPLIRIGFPIFDRHHLHRMTTLGYEARSTSSPPWSTPCWNAWTTKPAAWAPRTTTTTS